MQREFGTINRTVLFDDISDPAELKDAGLEYAERTPVISVNQYTLKALDLSLKGEKFSSFKLGNSYVLQDYVLRAVNEVLRVIKITIDINSPQESNVTIGDKITDLNEYHNDRGRLADDRHRQNQRKFNQLDLKDKSQDGLIEINKNNIEANKNNISTNSHNFGVIKERIDNIIEWRDGFIERYNDLIGIVNDLVANQNNSGGGGDYAIHLHYEISPDGSFHSGGNTINPQAYLGITGDNKRSLPRPV